MNKVYACIDGLATTSAVIDWAPYYSKVVEDTLSGKWQTGNFWWGVKEGAIAALCIVVAGLIPVLLLARTQLSGEKN